MTSKSEREKNKRKYGKVPTGYPENLQEARCQECGESFIISRQLIAPYYFADYRRSFWLCVDCRDPVHERYRDRLRKARNA